MRQPVRQPMLLAAVLAGCLNLAAAAEAHDRQGHHRQVRSFAQQPYAARHDPGWFAQRHDPRWSGQRHDPRWSGQRNDQRWFGPPSGLRAFAQPSWRRPGFGQRDHRMRFSHRPQVLRFVQRPPVPLSRQPGFRILDGRQILPFVSAGPARLSRPFGTFPGRRFPTFVRVFPGPGFLTGPGRFGIPNRSGGLTIILRDPIGRPPWQ